MIVRKIKTFLLIIFLAFVFFLEGAMAEICFCGKACEYESLNKTDLKINSIFHKRCPGNNCRACDIENKKSIKEVYFSIQALKVKKFTAFTTSDFKDSSSINQSKNNLRFFHYCRAILPSPIYIKNLCLRC
jgi:hypothetical protein